MGELEGAVSKPALPSELVVGAEERPMRQCSSSISAVPAKRKSTQADMASRLLAQLELLRRELHTLLDQDAHAAVALFERVDPNSTGRLSHADFCTALEHLGIGEQLTSTERVRTPLCGSSVSRSHPHVWIRPCAEWHIASRT
jgi:hypothetical protein